MRNDCVSVLLGISFSLFGSMASCYAQDLPLSHRVGIITPAFIAGATKVDALTVPAAQGSVLVTFRTSEQGRVFDTRTSGGTETMQQAAVDALKQWKFRPFIIAGQPAQLTSAVIFAFSQGTSSVSSPGPMTSEQVSPVLSFPCWNAITHLDQKAVELCKKQFDTVEKDRHSTPMEHFTAYDEYGLALLASHQPQLAEQQFAKAIQIAPQGLTASDAEWAYVYWHHAVAEQQLGKSSEADQDFSTAEKSMHAAADASGRMPGDYYQQLATKIAAQSSHPAASGN